MSKLMVSLLLYCALGIPVSGYGMQDQKVVLNTGETIDAKSFETFRPLIEAFCDNEATQEGKTFAGKVLLEAVKDGKITSGSYYKTNSDVEQLLNAGLLDTLESVTDGPYTTCTYALKSGVPALVRASLAKKGINGASYRDPVKVILNTGKTIDASVLFTCSPLIKKFYDNEEAKNLLSVAKNGKIESKRKSENNKTVQQLLKEGLLRESYPGMYTLKPGVAALVRASLVENGDDGTSYRDPAKVILNTGKTVDAWFFFTYSPLIKKFCDNEETRKGQALAGKVLLDALKGGEIRSREKSENRRAVVQLHEAGLLESGVVLEMCPPIYTYTLKPGVRALVEASLAKNNEGGVSYRDPVK